MLLFCVLPLSKIRKESLFSLCHFLRHWLKRGRERGKNVEMPIAQTKGKNNLQLNVDEKQTLLKLQLGKKSGFLRVKTSLPLMRASFI